MCGIAGYFSKSEHHRCDGYLDAAVKTLAKRGPDFQKTVTLSPLAGFAHARLSIIDTSSVANQPMVDDTGRYQIIFNGEIFNYRQLHKQFLATESFHSTSDTEVLLRLFIKLGPACVQHLNGFFAFAIYDNLKEEFFIARDRYGIKPLHIYNDGQLVVFASEVKAILKFPIQKQIDYNTLALYLQLNYVPATDSFLKHIQKLKPGSYATISNTGAVKTESYYQIAFTPGKRIEAPQGYDAAKSKLKELVDAAVERRLVADVPLGTFLSGGIDSSIVTACAARHVNGLNTFSIGYKDEPYFDETKYAKLVADRYKTNHTVFAISNDEMLDNVFSVLDYIDEPFADSSSLAVYVLCQKTRQKVTVALSGDGGDELFAGYNKHKAELNARKNNAVNVLMKAGLPAFELLPKSRHSAATNLFRQMHRYSQGISLKANERYWRWCTFNSQAHVLSLLKSNLPFSETEINKRKEFVMNAVTEKGDLNDVLYADMHLVLPGDMLTKVDLMSMANSLEVRVPLLDYTVVDYAFSLPVSYKIEGANGKKILKDAFRSDLPDELFNRPKHGFEVPLLKWLRTNLKSTIDDLLSEEFIRAQNIFEYIEIEKLKQKMVSSDPGDVHATIWALLVFQYWYKKYFAVNA